MAHLESKAQYYVGVDFGGTKIYSAVFDSKLELLGSARISTKAHRGAETVMDRISRSVHDAVDECDLSLDQVKGVGVGAPGAVEPDDGRVIFAPNLNWKNIPLKKALENKLGVPVFIENDANMAMIGVFEVELEAKPRHAAGIFIGTGIGGALFINGELYSGFNHTAGEIGHMVLDRKGPQCSCGNWGCFEALASRTAIFRKIQAAVKQGQKTMLTQMLGKDLKDMRSGHLRKAIRRGDKFVKTVVEEAAEYTGLAVGNLINLFNPEVVILGGGVIEALDEFMLEIITTTAMDHALAGTAEGIKIQASRLADNAGVTGGAVLARRGTK